MSSALCNSFLTGESMVQYQCSDGLVLAEAHADDPANSCCYSTMLYLPAKNKFVTFVCFQGGLKGLSACRVSAVSPVYSQKFESICNKLSVQLQ